MATEIKSLIQRMKEQKNTLHNKLAMLDASEAEIEERIEKIRIVREEAKSRVERIDRIIDDLEVVLEEINRLKSSTKDLDEGTQNVNFAEDELQPVEDPVTENFAEDELQPVSESETLDASPSENSELVAEAVPVDADMPEPTEEEIEKYTDETPDETPVVSLPEAPKTVETVNNPVVADTKMSTAVPEDKLISQKSSPIIYNNDGTYIEDGVGAKWFIYNRRMWRNNVEQKKTSNVLRSAISKDGFILQESFQGNFYLGGFDADGAGEVTWSSVRL